MKKFSAKHTGGALAALALAALVFTLLPAAWAQAVRNTLKGFKMPLSIYEGSGKAKSVLMGAEAQPLPDGIYKIKDVRLETYHEDGGREFLVTATECTFDQRQRHVFSPGPLQIQTGDGKFSIKGEGFEWRQAEARLIISNNVETTIQLESRKPQTKQP